MSGEKGKQGKVLILIGAVILAAGLLADTIGLGSEPGIGPKQILAITEKKVMNLIEEGKLQAYRIADKFLRLKRSEVLDIRNTPLALLQNLGLIGMSVDRL